MRVVKQPAPSIGFCFIEIRRLLCRRRLSSSTARGRWAEYFFSMPWPHYPKPFCLIVLTCLLWTFICAEPLQSRELVGFSSNGVGPGTVLVKTQERKLYFVMENGRAIRYQVGVGRSGKQWFGSTSIVSKHIRPAWSPPAEIRGSRPTWIIPSGSPNNPMGAAALVLADNELAIHGTNNPASIGGLVSWGCIRMNNVDVMDLYHRVNVGTPVVLMR